MALRVEKDAIARAILNVLISPNVSDSNFEPANVVDALQGIGELIRSAARSLGNGDASTPMGAIEAHGKAVTDAAGAIAEAIRDLADAVREHGGSQGT